MRDQIALGSALEDRFFWSVFPSMPTQERKAFDAACEKWEQWEEEQNHRSPLHPYRFLPNKHRTTTSVSTAGTLPLASENHSSTQNGLSGAENGRSAFRRSHSNLEEYGMPATPNDQYVRYDHIHKNASQLSPTSTSSRSTAIPPTRRLSRAMRVFVAWKS